MERLGSAERRQMEPRAPRSVRPLLQRTWEHTWASSAAAPSDPISPAPTHLPQALGVWTGQSRITASTCRATAGRSRQHHFLCVDFPHYSLINLMMKMIGRVDGAFLYQVRFQVLLRQECLVSRGPVRGLGEVALIALSADVAFPGWEKPSP